jgi:transposase
MTADDKCAYARGFPVHVGVDTAKRVHVLVARGPDGRRQRAYRVPVSRSGFIATDSYLTRLFPEVPREHMLVGIELAAHYGYTFAHFLAQQGYRVVNVLAAHTKRTKELEDNSPLKTDAKDAALICKLVGDGTFVGFPFLVPRYVELRVLVAYRHRLTVEATRFKNRLQALLDLAWPEFLTLFSSIRKETPRAILERWPLPEDLLAASRRTVSSYVRKVSRGKVTGDRVTALYRAAQNTIALPHATAARRMEIQDLLARWAMVRHRMATVDAQLEDILHSLPAGRALLTVPEVNAVCAATILSELGTPEDFEHPRQILKLAGMNLVERSSGRSHGRKKQSKRGRPMLRRQLFLLGGRWCLRRGLYRADYEALLARNGGLRTKAVCAVARKLVPLLFAIIKHGEPFDIERWKAARHHSRSDHHLAEPLRGR